MDLEHEDVISTLTSFCPKLPEMNTLFDNIGSTRHLQHLRISTPTINTWFTYPLWSLDPVKISRAEKRQQPCC